jgi:hypothetical protein
MTNIATEYFLLTSKQHGKTFGPETHNFLPRILTRFACLRTWRFRENLLGVWFHFVKKSRCYSLAVKQFTLTDPYISLYEERQIQDYSAEENGFVLASVRCLIKVTFTVPHCSTIFVQARRTLFREEQRIRECAYNSLHVAKEWEGMA